MPHDKIRESCIKGKQRQKNIPKQTKLKAEKAGERVYFDISSIQYKSLGGSKFWLLFIDEYMGFKKINLKAKWRKKGLNI